MIIDEDIYLEHFGVKGMRWGVRKQEKTGSDRSGNSDTNNPGLKAKIEKDLSKPKTAEQKRKLKEAEKTFEKKFEKSGGNDSKGWRPTGKQVAIAATGAVAVGLILYKLKTGNDLSPISPKSFSMEDYKKAVPSAKTPQWIRDYSGKKMDIAEYKGIVESSKGRIWANSMITKESFDQKEITLKSGHEFFRVTHGIEKRFNPATYTVSSKEDLARYALGWKANEVNIVNFKAKKDIKIPDLHNTLEAMREVLVENGVTNVTPKMVVDVYNTEAGNSWTSARAVAFAEKLKSNGYDAIIDHMDAGVYGEAPLVLFNPEKMTSKVTTLAADYDTGPLVNILADIPNRR